MHKLETNCSCSGKVDEEKTSLHWLYKSRMSEALFAELIFTIMNLRECLGTNSLQQMVYMYILVFCSEFVHKHSMEIHIMVKIGSTPHIWISYVMLQRWYLIQWPMTRENSKQSKIYTSEFEIHCSVFRDAKLVNTVPQYYTSRKEAMACSTGFIYQSMIGFIYQSLIFYSAIFLLSKIILGYFRFCDKNCFGSKVAYW